MDRLKKYLKALTLVPAIVLVGGFLAYRAGAFHAPAKPALEPQPEPATAQEPPATEGTAPATEPGLLPPGIVPSVLPHDPPPGTQQPTTRTGQFILGGSPKSDIIFRPGDLPTRDGSPSNSTLPPANPLPP